MGFLYFASGEYCFVRHESLHVIFQVSVKTYKWNTRGASRRCNGSENMRIVQGKKNMSTIKKKMMRFLSGDFTGVYSGRVQRRKAQTCMNFTG